MNLESQLFEHLVEALRLAAADYEQQVEALPSFVCIPDEIALTYADAVEPIRQIQAAGLVMEFQAAELKKLVLAFDEMNSKKELWTLDALATSTEWTSIRISAKAALTMLGFAWTKPSLGLLSISYVQSRSGT